VPTGKLTFMENILFILCCT